MREEQLTLGVSRFDLTLNLIEGPQGLTGGLEYDVALFSRETAERLVQHYVTLLGALAARAEEPLSRLALVSDDERRTLLDAWSGEEREYPSTSLPAVFAEQAVRRAETVAVVELDAQGGVRRTLSYAELDRRSNALARHLLQLGVAPDTPVGVCVERSAEMVVALLAILKAGGSYLPLDASYPPQRLELLLEDSGVGVLVVQDEPLSRLPAHAVSLLQVVRLQDEAAFTHSDAPLRLEGLGPDHLAYVTYTSGSTGVPKGVAVPQRGVLRLVKDGGFVEIADEDVFLQLAPVSFDASTLEIWGALLNGCRLVLAPAQTSDLHTLGRILREQEVSVLWLTAPLFHLMVEESGRGPAHGAPGAGRGRRAAARGACGATWTACPQTDG